MDTMFRYKKLSQKMFDSIANKNPEVYIPLAQTPQWTAFDELMPGRDVQGVFAYYDDEDRLMCTARIDIWTKKMRKYLNIDQGPVWFVEPSEKKEIEFAETIKDQFLNKEKTGVMYLRCQLNHQIPGAVLPFETTTYDRAMYIDITPDEKALLKSFKADARQAIRKAGRIGVEVREIPLDERVEFFEKNLADLMDETQQRNNFRAHPTEVYTNMLKAFPEEARLYVAFLDEEPISWLISTEYRGHAVYLYAAGGDKARKNFASYALQWYCIKEMKERGNKVWDMTGITCKTFPGLENVTVFKRKFSKWEVQLPITYDIVFNKLKYKAVGAATNARRKLL
ncbi:MAG: peptidoglycan bridge formation glycyltransferase FemA/FemB family protein [Micrococcaceae bacterium]